jgi:mannitol-1-/sugar-/sorbitol-6-phosphatase
MVFIAKGLLLDMDGVLVDSAPAVERVWREWAIEHGLDPAMVVAQAHGRRSVETLRAVAPQIDAERENIIVEQREIEDREGVTAFPGADRLLRALPAARFAIATSATRPLAVARMGHAGLPVPHNLITADDVIDGKPSPEPYLKGAALLRIASADCLVFEDTPAGIASARAAGMRVVAVGNTCPAEELRAADAHVASLAEVKAQIQGGNIELDLLSISQNR